MIVKDEEENLKHCLQSVANYVDEIIIVDTGSTDQTKEIAQEYTNKVFDYMWNDNFSDARNFSLSKASNDIVLVLDADEIVEQIEIDKIKRLVKSNEGKIGRLLRINEFTRDGSVNQYNERVNRLFSKKKYKYMGMIHEQVEPISLQSIPEDNTYLIPLIIRHSGYEGSLEIRKKKTDRNIRLLKRALEQSSDDPYLIYQLGKSFYMQEDYELAAEWFGKALYFDLNTELEYVQDMVESYGYSLINSGNYELALSLTGVYDEFSNSADFVFLIALIYMNNAKFDAAIEEFTRAISMRDGKMDGVNSYRAYYNIGVIYECLGKIKQAREAYHQCGNYEPALRQIANMRV